MKLVALAALVAFPFLVPPFYADLMVRVMILALFAMSLDLLVGRTGLVSFGHAAYFGLGAYGCVLLSPEYDPASLYWLLPAVLGCVAVAALMNGVVVLRTRGLYFIMATLAFAQVLYFVFHDASFAGGSDGKYLNFKPTTGIIDLDSPRAFYYLVLAVLTLATVFLAFVYRSPFGRALAGIKANEERMRSLGFAVSRYQLASYVLAGTLAGLAGFLFAVKDGVVNPGSLSWQQSGNVLLIVILGGVGRLGGAFAGALAFVALEELFRDLTKHWQLLMGATIIALVMLFPGGLAGLWRRVRG